MNLLEETIEFMLKNHLYIDEIIYIGSKDERFACTWEEFIKLSDFDYDNGYGINEITLNLIICFKNGTIMYRYEYDGAESWEIIRHIKRDNRKDYKKFESLKRIDEEF